MYLILIKILYKYFSIIIISLMIAPLKLQFYKYKLFKNCWNE